MKYLLFLIFLFTTQAKTENNSNLGKLFFEFIKFYAIIFDSNKVMVNINGISNNNIEFEFPNNNNIFSNDLIIIDPLNPFNNVAKSCSQFYNIKMAFLICLMTFQQDCECGCHYNQIEDNNKKFSEHCILKRLFNNVKRFLV